MWLNVILKYRVCARNARSRATPNQAPYQLLKNKAVEQHTIAIVIRKVSRVYY